MLGVEDIDLIGVGIDVSNAMITVNKLDIKVILRRHETNKLAGNVLEYKE